MVPLRHRRRRRRERVVRRPPRRPPRACCVKQDDQWMVCGHGLDVAGSAKIPCTEEHNWRAVTTIKLGEPGEEYPGDRVVEVKSRDFCSDSVGRLAELPDRLRLRLDLVPRGRVGGRQPPVRLLGEDGPVTRARRARSRWPWLAAARPAAPAPTTRRSRRSPASRRPPRRPPTPDAAPKPVPRPDGPRLLPRSRTTRRWRRPPSGSRSTARDEHTATTFHVGASRRASSTGTCSPSTRRQVQDRVAAECPRGSATSWAGPSEEQPAEHAAGRLVHADRRRSPTAGPTGSAAT